LNKSNNGGRKWGHIKYQEIIQESGRLFLIFSYKALVYTLVSGGVGFLFYLIFSSIGLKIVGIIILAIFALLGFIIGTFKVPEIETFEVTRKAGGQNIDTVLLRLIKFKMKKKKIYTYAKEEKVDEQ